MNSENNIRTDHDRLFKELFHTFFIEFVELFFPQLAKLINKKHIVFLAQEIFTDISDGEKHIVDILVETALAGEQGYVLIHVENQAQKEVAFNRRMFKYFSRLHEKYDKKVIPVAVFSHDSIVEEPDTYTVDFPFLRVLQFQYLKLHLKRENWRKYITSNNPVAAALLAKMNYTPQEAIKVKVEIARMIANLQLDPARAALITVFSDTYIPLDEQLWAEYENLLQKELNPVEVKRYMELTTSYHERGRAEGLKEGIERGIKKGIEKGIEKGKREGKADTIIKAVRKSYGSEPADLKEKLLLLAPEVLDELIFAVFSSSNLEQFLERVEMEISRE